MPTSPCHVSFTRNNGRIGLLDPRALNCAPLEEAIDRHDAASLSISVPEHGEPRDALGLGVDGPLAALRVLAPVRDQAPLDQIERALARLMVLPNDQEFLARRTIVAGRNVADAAVADIKAFDDGETKRSRTLDDATT